MDCTLSQMRQTVSTVMACVIREPLLCFICSLLLSSRLKVVQIKYARTSIQMKIGVWDPATDLKTLEQEPRKIVPNRQVLFNTGALEYPAVRGTACCV